MDIELQYHNRVAPKVEDKETVLGMIWERLIIG